MHVEHRALAGAVRADDGADLVLAHVEADVGQRLHAAEGERDVLERRGSTSPMRRAGVASALLPVQPGRSPARLLMRPLRRCAEASCASRDLQVGGDHAGAAVLELHLRLDVLRRCLPPYSASISTSYFSAMKPRRTLRVRVSSPSSASSSLCRIRKRRICESASLALAGEVGVDLLDALADQLVDLGLAPRGRCSRRTAGCAARPSCRPPRSRC